MEQFLINSYQDTHDATITSLHDNGTAVTLDSSIIYPGGGGQPSDKACLEVDNEQYTVVGFSRNDNGHTIYHLDKALPLDTQHVTEQIDWDFRFRNMRYHTLLHLVSGYLYNHYGALAKSSAIEEDHARLEIQFPEDRVPDNLDKESFKETIEQLIEQDLVISSEEVDREELSHEDLIRTYTNLIPESVRHVRLVKIEGLDEQACGGTHVAKSNEIGGFDLTQLKNKGRLKKRIKLALR